MYLMKGVMSDNKFLKIIKAIFSRAPVGPLLTPEEKPGLFVFEADGFVYPFKSGRAKIKWAEIERLEGYKKDQWTVDEISMDITWDGWKATFTEGMPGWDELQKKVKEVFPEVPSDWGSTVMLPPFDSNYVLLYERADRKMPAKTNFHASFENISLETVQGLLEERGWKSRKESRTCIELTNSWTDWWLEEDGYGLLLHGLVPYHPNNLALLDELFDGLGVPYKYEFYSDQNELMLQRRKPCGV